MNMTGALITKKGRQPSVFILILILISGQVDCAEMTAYTGGSVLILCKYDHVEKMNYTKYFCKMNEQQCTKKILSNTTDHEGRVFFVDGNWTGQFGVFMKNVSQHDKGQYRCGLEERSTPTEVTVEVKGDSCCGQPLTQKTHPGGLVTFTCAYPDEFKDHNKYLYKVTDRGVHIVIYTWGLSEQKERFSLHDHPERKFFSVNISTASEEDGGVYLCGVSVQRTHNYLFSFFSEIQLQVNAKTLGLCIIIPVSVCVALLLIGGLALIYKLKYKKTQGSASSSPNRRNLENSDEVHLDPCYEEILNTENNTTTVYVTAQKPSRANRTSEL